MWDGFLTKFGPNGDIQYSTFLGGGEGPSGSGGENAANGLAVDSAGNGYVALCTNAKSMPHLTTSGAIASTHAGSEFDKLMLYSYIMNFAHIRIILYATYFGARRACPTALAIDSMDDVYITGHARGDLAFPPPAPPAIGT